MFQYSKLVSTVNLTIKLSLLNSYQKFYYRVNGRNQI
jgi:hypothetical protein